MPLTNNPLELLVKVSADTAGSKKDLQTQLDELSSSLKGLDKLKLGIDQSDVKALKDIAKIDFSKLKEGITKPVKEGLQDIEKLVRVTQKDLDKALEKLGSFGGKGKVSSVEQIERDLKSIDPSAIIEVTKEVSNMGEEIKAVTALYKEAGIQRKVAFEQVRVAGSAQEDAISWMPKIIKETDLNLKDAARSTDQMLSRMTKLVEKGDLSSKAFEDLTSQLRKVDSAEALKEVNLQLDIAVKNQQRINQVDKEHEDGLERLLKLEIDLIGLRNRRKATFDKPENANAAKEIEEQIKSLRLATTQDLTGSFRISRQEVDSLKLSYDRLKASTAEAGRLQIGMWESFTTAMQKFPLWMAASTAFYTTVNSIRDAMQQIVEIDTQMTTLRRVGGEFVDTNAILKESIQLAKELGNTIADINEGFVIFARQGFEGETLSMLAEYATLLGNISDLSTEEAGGILTAGLKAFNMEAEQGIHIVNALNEVDNNYSVTTVQLAQAMQRSAGTASVYGASLERLIGYTTAIGEVTRESGNVIGEKVAV